MSKTMILAVGGAGCNMAETIMRVANAHWVKEISFGPRLFHLKML